MTYKILVFSSNPSDTEYLKEVDREALAIEDLRRNSSNGDNFAVKRIDFARIGNLQDEILKKKPRIVHFCGHGMGNGGIIWESESGGQQPLNTKALAKCFKLVADIVECVILNTCLSQPQAEAIHQHINYVVGTKNIIKDSAAIAFSEDFYKALFNQGVINDESIKRAYDLGINRIQLGNENDSSSGRKLIPVDTPEERLPAAKVFTFLVKDPLTIFEPKNNSTSGTQTKNIPSNLNKSGSSNFVGREEQVEEVHELLQQNEKVTISAIAGMGGIGKTELALQYANRYQEYYPGGLCWFSVRSENLGTQIIEFARTYLEMPVPEELETDFAKVKYCWQKWNSKPSLVVLDDVINYGDFYRDSIKPYLPPVTSQVKVLMTSREKPGKSIPRIDLNVLSENSALQFLKSLIGERRLENKLGTAKELCKWLGYLPLGLELVGRYIDLDDNLTIEKTLQRLKRKELRAKALLNSEQADMTAQLGVAAAFDLSWDVLTPEAQELGCYLSLFDSEPFKWSWVKTALIEVEDEEEKEDLIEELESLRNRQLSQRNLLTSVRESPDSTKYNYQLHSLIAQHFRAKLEAKENAAQLKQKFCRAMKQVAQSIDDSPTLKEIQTFSIAIPHLSYVAQELTEFVNDENLIWSYVGLGRYYQGQGLYNRAVEWYEECLTTCRKQLGEEHPDVAQSLNNLAYIFCSQGRYEDAEPLYIKALELYKQILGEEHPDVAQVLNNLAALYYSQGRYEEAETLYIKALELYKQILGEEHPDVAQTLNNLAALYYTKGRYKKAEPLFFEVLELRKQLLGEEHPDVAQALNNLAELYRVQGRYEEAEPLFIKALELYKQILGEEHPDVAQSLNNLAELYRVQGRYEEAEPLFIKALELYGQILGEEHPNVAQTLNNLAALYYSQGRYEEAETLYIKALELYKQILGEEHPDVAQSLNNLAELYRVQGRYEEAEPLFIKALELYGQILGEEHPNVAQTLNNLAPLYSAQRRYKDAEPLYKKALQLRQKLLGEKHPDVAQSLNNLALFYRVQGKYEDANPLYKKALEIAATALGKNHPSTKTIQKNFEYCMMMKHLNMPEAEMRKILPSEVCEQLLQYKRSLELES